MTSVLKRNEHKEDDCMDCIEMLVHLFCLLVMICSTYHDI